MVNPREDLLKGIPVRDFLLYVTSNSTLLEVVWETSSFSLHVSSVMQSWRTDPTEDFANTSIGRMSESAQREVESGFPLLYANSLIGLWGALEACIDDLCVLFLQCMDRQRLGKVLGATRVRIGEYFGLEDEDRWLWLLAQLQKSDASSLKAGIGQFESFLKPLGISPQVDQGVRTTLFRIKAMRNLYAHRAGRADARFIQEWPDHPALAGQIVVPTSRQVLAADTAMVLYVEGIHASILSELGEVVPKLEIPPWIKTTEDLLSLLTPNPNVPEGAPWSHHWLDQANRYSSPNDSELI